MNEIFINFNLVNSMIKWGIIGLGKVAKEFAQSFSYVDNSNLVGIASKSLDKISYFKNKFNIQFAFY